MDFLKLNVVILRTEQFPEMPFDNFYSNRNKASFINYKKYLKMNLI